MSPLWSEKALAHAAWVKALDLGLVHDDKKAQANPQHKAERTRRIVPPRRHSYAL